MVCYSIVLASAIILFIARKKTHNQNAQLGLLNLMLAGGAVMLVIDHLWNGELFLVSPNIVSDLLLGALMTAGVILFWGLFVATKKIKGAQPILEKTE